MMPTRYGIAHDEHEAGERIAAERAVPFGELAGCRRPSGAIECHCASSRRCRNTATTNMPAPRYSTPELPMRVTKRLVSSGPDQRAGGAARGDQTEQPLGLLAAQDLEHEAPEHRDQHEVHDADADVEHARERRVLRIVLEHHGGGDERHGHESVDGGQQHRAPDVRHQPAVERDDEDGEERGVQTTGSAWLRGREWCRWSRAPGARRSSRRARRTAA